MSVADEIEKLHRLREQGALTEEEFSKAKAALLDGRQAGGGYSAGVMIGDPLRNFFRSQTDRWLGGVCGGLGEVTAIPSWFWRLLFALLAVCGGAGFVFYILMWIFVPVRPAG
jgi:phage shock protein PspC (stress-responsive transcriptional regulator)